RGYAAPEYSWEGALTYKCDVYSFGVVLLEIISGKRRTNMPMLLLHAWELWNESRSRELFDREEAAPRGEVLSGLARCIQIGLLCVQHLPEHRPHMSEVVRWLADTGPRPP
uniref:Protein kinase domain-containing protein n=1 Tax=Triticum urartu TaxID=4572 RepID=A0A8R7TPL4_TRIUA